MYLERVDIANFRGIRRMGFNLRPNMVLIGENAWGKSSLFAALSLIFNPQKPLYQFVAEDVHISENSKAKEDIILTFTFCEDQNSRPYLEQLIENKIVPKTLFTRDDKGKLRIHLSVLGLWKGDKIVTQYQFLNAKGNPLGLKETSQWVKLLIDLHPVYRLKEAELQAEPLPTTFSTSLEVNENAELEAFQTLVKAYFMHIKMAKESLMDFSILWTKAKSLGERLSRLEKNSPQNFAIWTKRMAESLGSLFNIQPPEIYPEHTNPILLVEDLGAGLHPRMAAIMWHLSAFLPIQRIISTNSVELLSQAKLTDICRLVRKPDSILAYQLKPHSLHGKELRKLNFHIHHNRSMTLFSRTWLLVEGETEVWLVREIAEQLGIFLDQEGIRIVEFAQVGLKPLLKYAQAMGIEWFVLADGDEAGQKYAQTVRDFQKETKQNRLMILPERDIEHFFYYANPHFTNLFIELAHLQKIFNPTQATKKEIKKLIDTAIHKTSKPDLALKLGQCIEKLGIESIPKLFRDVLFPKLINLSREED